MLCRAVVCGQFTTRVDSGCAARRRRQPRAVFGWNDQLLPMLAIAVARRSPGFVNLSKTGQGVSLCGSPRASTAAETRLVNSSTLR